MTTSVQAHVQPTVINGVNVDDVLTLIDSVKNNPQDGQTKWKVTSVWQNQTHMQARVDSFHMGGNEIKRTFTIDIDEPEELGGANAFANPQEHLIAALNACMMVGFVVLCSIEGIKLDHLEIETKGDIDLHGFFGLDKTVRAGYENLDYTVRISGNGTKEQFAKIHETVMATSPNFYNISNAVKLNPTLIVE